MKVVISVKPMQSGSKNRGIGAYTRELVHALTSKYPDDQFIPTSHDYYSFAADLVHFPFFDPFFLTLPWRRSLPTVVTIHDLISIKYPRHFPRGIRGNLKWQIQKTMVKRINHIITDSEASAKDINSILHIPCSQISVIALASASDKLDPRIIPAVKKEYDLPEKYLLYVGDINWNKNVPGLIRAFSEIESPDVHLVLVGKAFTSTVNIPELKLVKKAIAASPKRDLIHTIGYIPAPHLPAVFKLATLYVQPSWDEGFGLPLLEAMRVGCPVASSNRGSLPEVGGNAAIYFDPTKNMAEIIDKALSSTSLRVSLVKKGREQVKKFSWDLVAEQTHAVYTKIMS